MDNYGLVYVTDQNEGKIQIYDEYGGFIEEFVIPVVGPGPLGVCFDIDNNLYVVDAWNNMIHVFEP